MRQDDEEKEVWQRQYDKGSIVDFLLTEDGKFNEFFEVVKEVHAPNPNTQLWKFNNVLINQVTDWDDPVYDFDKAYEDVGIKSPRIEGIKSATKEDFLKNFDYSWLKFYEKKQQLKKKGICAVLEEDVIEAKKLCLKIANLKAPNIARYFINIPDVYETLGQVEVYGILGNCPVKIKIDRMCFDMINKTALLGDVKTTMEYSSNFDSSFTHFQYDIQGDFYTEVYKKADIIYCNRDLSRYKDFEVLPYFDFIVIPKNESSPMVRRYETGKRLDDIYLAVNMYTTLDEKGLKKTKQVWYDYMAEKEGYVPLRQNEC